jgi:hypothetical protein
MNKQLLETIHRATYMADCRRAAALGLTEPEYRGARAAAGDAGDRIREDHDT